ncbi:unnamed protein product [Rhodiola kirilowii]
MVQTEGDVTYYGVLEEVVFLRYAEGMSVIAHEYEDDEEGYEEQDDCEYEDKDEYEYEYEEDDVDDDQDIELLDANEGYEEQDDHSNEEDDADGDQW